MTNIFILQESITNGYKAELLFILSLICIFAGISIIITKNPILSVLFLIALFFTIAIYLMSLGFYFIGLSYLLVYVGAVSILFLFILMLINVRISELLTEGRNSIPLAILAIISFSYSVGTALPSSIYLLDSGIQPIFNFVSNLFIKIFTSLNKAILGDTAGGLGNLIINDDFYLNYSNKIANISSKSWDSLLIEISHITSIGNTLYSNLFILLIVTSFILLLAMVGSIVITVKDKKFKQYELIALTSNFKLPKAIKIYLSILITLCLVGLMLKGPVLILSKVLNLKWIYTIYSIALIYPFWVIRVSFTEKRVNFTLTYFMYSSIFIILIFLFLNHGYLAGIFASVSGIIIPYSPWNIGRLLASKYPLPEKLSMHLDLGPSKISSAEAKSTHHPDNYHKADSSDNTGSSEISPEVLHQENINKLHSTIESLNRLKNSFITYSAKNSISIIHPSSTPDGCVGFVARDNQTTAIHMKKTELQVLYEKAVNHLVKSQLFAKNNGLDSQPINKLGATLFNFHSSFPLFSSPELEEINRESYQSGGNREIYDPRVKASSPMTDKRSGDYQEGNPSKITKAISELPIHDIFNKP